MPRPPDKRDTERIEILGELRGEVMVFQPLAIREISRRGLQIEVGFPLQVDSLHEFRLTLDDRSIVVKGRVAHCRICDVDQGVVRYRAGIELVESNPHADAAVAAFMETISADRARRSDLV